MRGRTLHYDAKGQPARVERDDGTVASYEYDHKGNRVSKRVTDPGGTVLVTRFIGP